MRSSACGGGRFSGAANGAYRGSGCSVTSSAVTQQARQFAWGLPKYAERFRILIRDCDQKFTAAFDDVFRGDGLRILRTPIRSPQANGVAERLVRTARAECLDWVLIANQRQLERTLRVFVDHHNRHRPHRALGLVPPAPLPTTSRAASDCGVRVHRRDRLGGLVHEYTLARER